MSTWHDRLYMGTWQLSGDFKPLSEKDIAAILHVAWEQGIRRFDTAAVYGQGHVERLLSILLPTEAMIVTKIPANVKPPLGTTLSPDTLYPKVWLESSLHGCQQRLQRDQLDTVLLHNWIAAWQDDEPSPLHWLRRQKEQGIIRRIGVSLPDLFARPLGEATLSLIDIIETPYNPSNQWILDDLDRLRSCGIEILLRSLFNRGARIKTESPSTILTDAWQHGTSLVVGMSTPEQIRQNCACLARLGENNG